MNADKVLYFKTLLEEKLADLSRRDALGADGQKTVTLDQQSVGRLSRMDALQGQAMAQATAARRNAEATRIRAALGRIAEDEFGYCLDCGDEISEPRLHLDPAAPLCISCAKG